MSRNVRTYEHFCLLARALERVGERWTLLVIRDLLSGPKRFTDLMDRLGGITPKTLSLRLRELEEGGLVEVDREPGRREVWYRLTEAGADLRPAVEALSLWGARHAWRPPGGGEALHAEHLLAALTRIIDRTAGDPAPARWHLEMEDDGDYVIESEGGHWTLRCGPPGGTPDVTVSTNTFDLRQFLADPTPSRASALGIRVSGAASATARFHRLMDAFRKNVLRSPTPRRPDATAVRGNSDSIPARATARQPARKPRPAGSPKQATPERRTPARPSRRT